MPQSSRPLTPQSTTDPYDAINAFAELDSPAASHWAVAIHAAIFAREDPITLRAWSKLRGRSCSSLRETCARVDVSAKASIDLARLLRLARVTHSIDKRHPERWLEISDRRTWNRILDRGGLSESDLFEPRDLLYKQRFIDERPLIRALDKRLSGELWYR